jgi:membrane protein DedA with SNARE-associated domain
MLEFLYNLFGLYGYAPHALAFVLLTIGGYLIPVPEEILLLLVGYAASAGVVDYWAMVGVGLVSVLLGDNILYWLALRGSSFVQRFRKKISERKLEGYTRLMEAHMGKALFLSRFLVGLRFLGPFLAGSMKVKWGKFQFYNFLALALYVPFFIFLGYHFHANLLPVFASIRGVRHILAVVFLVGAGLAVTFMLNRRFTQNGNNRK